MPFPKLSNYFFDEIKQRLENHKTPYQTIIVAGDQMQNFENIEKAAKFLCVNRSSVSKAKSKKRTCKGFKII